MENNQDDYIKKALQKDKLSDQQVFDKFANHLLTSKVKVSSMSYKKQVLLVVFLILLIIGICLFLANSYFNFFSLSSISQLGQKPLTNTTIEQNQIDNSNSTIENKVENIADSNEVTNETNEIEEDNTIIENSISENTTNIIATEASTGTGYATISPAEESNISDINLKELKQFVQEFSIGINRLSFDNTENLESNTILLYLAKHHFDTHSSSKYSTDVDTSFAPLATNIHKYLTEFTGKDYSSYDHVRSYNNYVGYAPTSKSYVSGKDLNLITKEKYSVSDLEITNGFSNIFTAKATVTRTLDDVETIYKIVFTFTVNSNYTYQKFCLKSLEASNRSFSPDNTVHLVEVSN